MENSALKQCLFQYCTEFVNRRIENARLASESAQDSANMEEKSSAGDKYETGRAMAQLENEKALQQLAEANKLKSLL
ncbi:MAG: 3-oxoacyl-ACP synthase, partial [Cyclobacteriaceae bacterium]|nr:3-oxoacyl-ACP synthase [Cyclobacteriaceae bacterium]